MTQLLGTKYCIESLLQDISDVQEIVNDICSRVGQINYQSWKFPDKLSCDVDVQDLLSEYQFEEGDAVQNEVTHVMLYDLLIDRLLFLMQCFTHFNEVLLDSRSNQSKSNNTSSSAGLTAKKCWSRLSQVAVSMQQFALLVQKASTKSDREAERFAFIGLKAIPSLRLNSNQSAGHQGSSESLLFSSRDKLFDRSCQTDETTYVSCEICNRTQSCLYDVGKMLVKVCKSQSLPSSLEDYLMKQSHLLSVAELTRWKNLQMKDLSRIDRQIESLMKQISPLKKDFAEAQSREDELRARLQHADATSEKKMRDLDAQFVNREEQLKEAERDLKRKVSALSKENNKLKEKLEILDAELSETKNNVMDNVRLVREAENEKSRLKKEVLEGRQHGRDALRLQAEITELLHKLQRADEKLQISGSLLEKEKIRNKTMKSHEQALQSKQQGLVERLEELNEECDELRDRLVEVEEERDTIKEEVANIRRLPEHHEEETQLQKENCSLTKKVIELEKVVRGLETQLQEQIERERLLVSYPDLHKSHGIQIIENSGDVYTDMRRQVDANELRIKVLEKENLDLRRTLEKLSPHETRSSSSLRCGSPRQQENISQHPSVQLWKPRLKSDIDLEFLGLSSSTPPKDSKNNKAMLSMKIKQNTTSAEKKSRESEASPARKSFSVGPGKRRTPTPVSSRPSSGRSALLKPWT